MARRNLEFPLTNPIRRRTESLDPFLRETFDTRTIKGISKDNNTLHHNVSFSHTPSHTPISDLL